ncbi:MAG: UDP-N-acetylglucosamine 2-epimerase (hydrolyzing) [Akkermansiaceae bacterium]|nr:UDP-N-acetylglucosamine 2-epimerase (hydrolyzing) [Akkermansiaceae bacterium]
MTGSRADYGLLLPVLRAIKAADDLELRLYVTGMHLAPEFGSTVRVIEEDGFPIQDRVEMLLAGDSPAAIAKSTGLGLIGFAEAFSQSPPDIVVVLGDRFEILAVAQACLFLRIPLAHIAGGDTTEGAVDEGIRHAITKMAHLHFVTNEESAARVRQMGEDPRRVIVTGSPGIDAILSTRLLSRDELAASLGIPLHRRLLAVTFHPATLEDAPQSAQMQRLLDALDTFDPAETTIIFTMPNADADGRTLTAMVQEYTGTREHTRAFASLGLVRYLSLVSHADAVVGNSSSGLYEAPTLRTPTVNIGDRQKGRLHASSVLHCPADADAISTTIHRAFGMDTSATTNPYGDGQSAGRIVEALRSLEAPSSLLRKHFHSLP